VGAGFISSSVDSKEMKKIIKEVCETAKKISKEMGYIERKGLETFINASIYTKMGEFLKEREK
jgi:hypothetical protein